MSIYTPIVLQNITLAMNRGLSKYMCMCVSCVPTIESKHFLAVQYLLTLQTSHAVKTTEENNENPGRLFIESGNSISVVQMVLDAQWQAEMHHCVVLNSQPARGKVKLLFSQARPAFPFIDVCLFVSIQRAIELQQNGTRVSTSPHISSPAAALALAVWKFWHN